MGNADNRLSFNSMYVGTPCKPVPFKDKTHDMVFVGDLGVGWGARKFKLREDRRTLCKWANETNYSMSVCGRGIQCPALANSRFGFHVRGDSISANRLFDTLLSSTIPVFTRPEQFDAHQQFIDWNKLGVYVPLGPHVNKESFLEALKKIMENKPDIARKTQIIIEIHNL